jgi:hypothetical protein
VSKSGIAGNNVVKKSRRVSQMLPELLRFMEFWVVTFYGIRRCVTVFEQLSEIGKRSGRFTGHDQAAARTEIGYRAFRISGSGVLRYLLPADEDQQNLLSRQRNRQARCGHRIVDCPSESAQARAVKA